ncbi:MAG: hypothetical protein WAQ33_13955 [Gaiellaceae bacterium]
METSAARRRPVGMILVEAGAINVEDLVSALAEQRKTRRRLGEILIDSGRITWLQLAEAITEQARDLDPAAAPPPQPASAQPAAPKTPLPPPRPPVSVSTVSAGRPDIEVMLMERQRAFLELVAVTETLRSTVTRLQDELAQRDAEITRLRALPLTG